MAQESMIDDHVYNIPHSFTSLTYSYGVTYLGIFDNSLQYLDAGAFFPIFSLHPSSYTAANRTRIIGHPVVRSIFFLTLVW